MAENEGRSAVTALFALVVSNFYQTARTSW